MKCRVCPIYLSRGRVRWIVMYGTEQIVGFKQQRQFKTFAAACFIASVVSHSQLGE